MNVTQVTRTRQTHKDLVLRVLNRVFGKSDTARILNGERALQCALYKEILEDKLDSEHQVLVEPGISSADDGGDATKKKPDLLLVRRPRDSADGIIDICLELKFLPWGHATFEKDIEKLSTYMLAKRLQLRHEFDLNDGKHEKSSWFRIDRETLWGFVAVGQADSDVAKPHDILKRLEVAREKGKIARTTTGKGILAACLVARSPKSEHNIPTPKYWTAELGEGEVKCFEVHG